MKILSFKLPIKLSFLLCFVSACFSFSAIAADAEQAKLSLQRLSQSLRQLNFNTSFVDDAYDELSVKDQGVFERLLTEQDPDLFAWFMGHKTCEDSELNTMVQFILNRVKV